VCRSGTLTGSYATRKRVHVYIYIYILCESTAAEAVDDMQRMNVADRMKNGMRPTEGGGATHTKGPHKSGPPHRETHKAANRRPQRDPHRKHTDIYDYIKCTCIAAPQESARQICARYSYSLVI